MTDGKGSFRDQGMPIYLRLIIRAHRCHQTVVAVYISYQQMWLRAAAEVESNGEANGQPHVRRRRRTSRLFYFLAVAVAVAVAGCPARPE
jgi:hypothetical protein